VSDSSSNSTRSVSDSSFGGIAKGDIKSACGNRCWFCGATPTQACHIIAKGDENALGLLKSRSMQLPESFSISSVSNGIALCPTCHVNFDTYEDPGLVIVPSNLYFFVISRSGCLPRYGRWVINFCVLYIYIPIASRGGEENY